MNEIESNSHSLLHKLLTCAGSEEKLSVLVPKLNQIPHSGLRNLLLGKCNDAMNKTINPDEFVIKIAFVILEHIASENDMTIQESSREIIWLCLNNVKYICIDHRYVSQQFRKNVIVKNWIGGILLNPEMCSDPNLPLEIMCLKHICDIHLSSYYVDFWSDMAVSFIIIIHQLDIEKYISSCLDDKLLNFKTLMQILKNLSYVHNVPQCHPTPSLSHLFEKAAKRLDKNNPSELTIDFCSKINEICSQTLLIHIKNQGDDNVYGILASCTEVANFFSVYFKIRVEICNVHLEKHQLIEASIRSAIATITNCILLLKANHQGVSNRLKLNPNIFNQMEILRDHMAKVDLGFDFGISVEQFLAQRSLGNFDISCTKKLYSVTTNIKQIHRTRTERTLIKAQGDDLMELNDALERYYENNYPDTDEDEMMRVESVMLSNMIS